MWRADSFENPWCWKRLGAGGEGEDRGWDGWKASPTQWTWVWVNSGSWWWTGRSVHGVAKSQTRLSDWMNQTELTPSLVCSVAEKTDHSGHCKPGSQPCGLWLNSASGRSWKRSEGEEKEGGQSTYPRLLPCSLWFGSDSVPWPKPSVTIVGSPPTGMLLTEFW